MREITTGRLTDVLLQSGLDRFHFYKERYSNGFASGFAEYFQQLLSKKGVRRSAAIGNSGIEVHYGYQILSGSKKPSRDKVICLCIGGGLSLGETQRALAVAGLGELYPKRMRDAAIMLAINHGVSNIWMVNDILSEHGLPLLV